MNYFYLSIYSDRDLDQETEREEATCAPDLALIRDHQDLEADLEIIERSQEDLDHNSKLN
jgi:hypothetical protein